jgi:hypothetical protein
MSEKYKELDRAILRKIQSHANYVEFYRIAANTDVDHQASLIAINEKRQSYRIIDGRLQALRRAKLIRHNGLGWIMGAPQERANEH